MKWKKIRIDFTETVKCQFCARMITSGKGIVVQDEMGNLAFSGPSCAQNRNGPNIVNPKEKVIDITKGCVLQEPNKTLSGKEQNSTEQDNFTSKHDNEVHDYLDVNAVKAYLILRFEKLSHLTSILKSRKLNEIYQNYKQTGQISSGDENYLRTIMYRCIHSAYTYQNLQAVYAAEYWLNSFIEHHPDNDLTFISSTLTQLRKKLTLTEKQILAINNWFKHSDGKMVKLKANAFVRDV
ncbi:hypothetical protein [Pasteurella bettyae]|uniref:Uncharacterized protein n=1 Tax=Pasteurella bettyae CCUG 2042 TaxID=1095749 RepID=I3DDC0_9PAST|nr:hypothetical protein [Pasteurella bettyae]EIJ69713.1 hypothetical protein HMPREF1052_1721 [Pasteurella bettyae CCUG 2042]SUB22033.1 Uncharacterised protein [Pasteurella bettyae]